jgi:ABC-type branched-subunit amino acid transport system ATPase component
LLENAGAILKVVDIVTGYGKKTVLRGVTVDVMPGEIVALIGHNGAGKSTLLKCIFGLVPVWDGEIRMDERRLQRQAPLDLVRLGGAYVPQGNQVFTSLTVRENLEIGAFTISQTGEQQEAIQRVLNWFPTLRGRLSQRAGSLSGGERQMLSLASALTRSPRLLLLDEPSLGLAPRSVSEALSRIQELSHATGVAVLLVEQKVREALRMATRVYVLRNGTVTHFGPSYSITDEVLQKAFL